MLALGKLKPHKTDSHTVWSFENRYGSEYDIMRNHVTGKWTIYKLDNGETEQIYSGTNSQPVFDLLKEYDIGNQLAANSSLNRR